MNVFVGLFFCATTEERVDIIVTIVVVFRMARLLLFIQEKIEKRKLSKIKSYAQSREREQDFMVFFIKPR